MSAPRLTRVFPGDLEIRDDGRTVVGIAVPFNAPAEVRDTSWGRPYTEMFARGAFARTIAERAQRVKFLVQHDRLTAPIGRASALREDAAGLYAELRVSQTAAGDEALTLIRDGALDGLSVGFQPVAQTTGPDGAVVRTEVRLNEISATGFPAYEDARVLAVRSEAPGASLLMARRRLELAQLAAARYLNREDRNR